MRYSLVYLSLFLAFILGSYKGDLALWLSPGGEPDYVFPYRVSSLPPQDQNELAKGVIIASRAELMALLEDYLS